MTPGYFERQLHARLAQLDSGHLTLIDGTTRIDAGNDHSLAATITVHDPRFYRAVALGGHLGAVDAYVAGWWRTDDLTAVVQILVRNRAMLDGLETGAARLLRPVRRVLMALERNTRRGSRKNIMAHYDLGNDFFAEFLDDTLTYSAGIFEHAGATMRDASVAKYERLCQKLALTATDRVIEIGSGWGGFAIHAAGNHGCKVVTTTISREQHQLAAARISAAGLADRVTVLFNDYRDLHGRFDKLVSIEMIEAVGHQYHAAFLAQCANLLEPHGVAAIQAITIQDRFYDGARREMDFIKRYIFPGSCIPSISALTAAASATDLRLVQLEDITPHYAETIKRWRIAFDANWPAIKRQGFTEEFRRLWQFYFAYCEGGFREAVIGDAQLIFAKPRAIATLALPRPHVMVAAA